MQSAPPTPHEADRLATLLKYEILDSGTEVAFDELTELASQICNTPISLISLVDDKRQWFKSCMGLEVRETTREVSFCAHALLGEGVFEVPDAPGDVRFADNPLVTGGPAIQFYAGARLVAPNGEAVGTLCVIDTKPRVLTEFQRRGLEILARQVVSQMEMRLYSRKLERVNREREKLFATIAHDLRSPFTAILGLSKMLAEGGKKLTPARLSRIASNLLSSSTQYYQLLDELLQWSQARMGAIACQPETHRLQNLVVDAAGILKDALNARNLVLENLIDSDIEVRADSSLTRTVIRNLMANAIKYSPDAAAIVVEARVVGDWVEVSVADSGIGIASNAVSGIFGGPDQSAVGLQLNDGYGLGLSLCRDFVEMQGGRIWLDQTHAPGSRFVFTVPNVHRIRSF